MGSLKNSTSPRNSTTVRERPLELDPGTGFGHWIVTVFDNDHNTVEEVLQILMRGTGCTQSEAMMETWEIHNLGKSVVHLGAESACREAAEIIATIGIRVEVGEE
jgi:ATP-dependent Clp protease adapter protein ClpS